MKPQDEVDTWFEVAPGNSAQGRVAAAAKVFAQAIVNQRGGKPEDAQMAVLQHVRSAVFLSEGMD